MYAIVDIETTGGSPVSEKITEIAIFIHDGKKVIEEFVSLVNPEKKIPYYITQITGITNSMVSDAPKFYEIAKKIVELTTDNIFVAHNADFDYNFIKNEFKNLGYYFQSDKLCTVKLSRKIIPGYKSYSLGKLCKELGITIEGRHRAAGDALATVKLFELLLKTNNNQLDFSTLPGISLKELHPNFNPQELKKLPDDVGVYYFYNEKNDLIYIGKSKNIKTRILSHFRNISTKKAFEMRNAIASIDYELTGSELIALLKESQEIKQNRPLYNRAQRRAMSQYGLYSYVDSKGYIRFEIKMHSTNTSSPICSFSGNKRGKEYLQNLVQKYRLCQKMCGLYKTSGACFNYEILECNGACIDKEDPAGYNIRAQKVIELHKFRHNSFYIIENGKDKDEYGVVKIENGKYCGYGYIDRNYYNGNMEFLSDCIKRYTDDRDIQQILRQYLLKGKPLDIIPMK